MKTMVKLMALSGFSKKTALMISSALKESEKIRKTMRKMQQMMIKKQRMKKKKMRKILMEWKKKYLSAMKRFNEVMNTQLYRDNKCL